MKVNLFSAVLLLVLFSCAKDNSEENLPPPSPMQTFPADREECLFSPLSLEWTTTTDPEGDPVFYKLEISESNNFNTIAFSTTTTESRATFELEPGTTYFWRVKAVDNKSNSSSYSDIRSFFTQPQIFFNHFPSSPKLEEPAEGAEVSGSTALLKWNSVDPDGDLLKYDLYFGSSNSPSILKENLEASQYEVSVEPGKSYFWKVVAKDGKGVKSVGPIWKFKT